MYLFLLITACPVPGTRLAHSSCSIYKYLFNELIIDRSLEAGRGYLLSLPRGNNEDRQGRTDLASNILPLVTNSSGARVDSVTALSDFSGAVKGCLGVWRGAEKALFWAGMTAQC